MNYNKKIFLIVNIINELKTSNSQIQVVKINNYLQKLDKELEEEVKNTITLYYSDIIDSYKKLLYKFELGYISAIVFPFNSLFISSLLKGISPIIFDLVISAKIFKIFILELLFL